MVVGDVAKEARGVKRYILPVGMRYATLSERRRFYREEFDLTRVEAWFDWSKSVGKLVFAVIMGRHTGIFPEKYREDAATTVLIDEYKDLEDFRAQVLEFLPESVYYDRNLYDEKERVLGQELAFDVDPENFVCPVHGTLEDKMRRRQGLGFCKLELDMAKAETVRLYEQLERTFGDMRIVYSGRGFHIHVFDEETLRWTRQKRSRLARRLKREQYHIDAWVTSGGMRLIRLPYSLHGMVSRIVLPITVDELVSFDPVTDRRCIPKFLKNTSKS
jgi:DNA primase catalytic subunit